MPKERLLHDPEKVKQAIWKNQRENESWKFHERAELGNKLVGIFYDRLINGVLAPGESPLPKPILGIEVLPYKQCGHFKLTEDAYGNRDVIISNALHIELGEFEFAATILHECFHLEFEHKDPEMNRKNPHGKRFRDRCESVGLYVNAKGQHYKPEGGVFKELMAEIGIYPKPMPELPPDHKGSYFLPPKLKGKSTLHKWECPKCRFAVNATTSRDIKVNCSECGEVPPPLMVRATRR